VVLASPSTIGVPEAGGPGHASAPTLPNRAVHVQAALRRGGRVARGARESLRAREPGQLNGPGGWRWSQCVSYVDNHASTHGGTGSVTGRRLRQALASYRRPIRREVERLLDAGQRGGVPKTAGTCREMLKLPEMPLGFRGRQGRPGDCRRCHHMGLPTRGGKAYEVALVAVGRDQGKARCPAHSEIGGHRVHQHGDTFGQARTTVWSSGTSSVATRRHPLRGALSSPGARARPDRARRWGW
jgi:hypothetical protein